MHTFWSSFAVYYSDVDRLIVDVLDPLRGVFEESAAQYHWVRHFAGGPHVRIHVRTDEAGLRELEQRALSEIQAFLDEHPSPPKDNYDPDRTRRVLAAEGYNPSNFDLEYRNNVLCPVERNRDRDVFASEEAIALMESFRQDILPLIAAIIRSPVDRLDCLFRLCLLHCKIVGDGDYVAGVLSFKSHWEGFRLDAAEEVVTTLQAPYEQQTEDFRIALYQIDDWYDSWTRDGDASTPVRKSLDPSLDGILRTWASIEELYLQRVYDLAKNGATLVSESDREEWKAVRQQVERSEKQSSFVEHIADEDFGPSMKYNPLFTTGRVLINFLYLLIAEVGGRPLDKYLLCHATYRSVEDNCSRSLEDSMTEVIQTTKEMNPNL